MQKENFFVILEEEDPPEMEKFPQHKSQGTQILVEISEIHVSYNILLAQCYWLVAQESITIQDDPMQPEALVRLRHCTIDWPN